MRLPGTRYQEPGWEQVRKLLGQASVQMLRTLAPDELQDPALLDRYVDETGALLHACRHTARAAAAGNSYGDSVGELALSLLYELPVQPAFWQAFLATLETELARSGAFWQQPSGEGMLRKKLNDLYAGLRDRIDADGYMVATGRSCTPNRIYTYRMLDTAYGEIAALFADWQAHSAQVGAILGRELQGIPIEVRQMKSIAGCKADWVIAWSATLEQFSGAAGPLHTRSKRFASLKNSPDKIAAMLAEIGEYEQLSANQDSAETFRSDAEEAGIWLEDYWRVLHASEQHEQDGGDSGPDLLLMAEAGEYESEADGEVLPDSEHVAEAGAEVERVGVQAAWAEPDETTRMLEQQRASDVSLPPGYLSLARLAQHAGSRMLGILAQESLPIRLAVYHKLLGVADDSYPDVWLDPATGELPTLQQLAALDGISMPTLRKRRNEAIDKLYAARPSGAA
ncbi:hypothetical protein [Pseudoduganella danionis]|uniref:hypothetical protein n=1 Tax=Pseudoduganella danionis TaxID=1890295 RepID=UPI0035B2547B